MTLHPLARMWRRTAIRPGPLSTPCWVAQSSLNGSGYALVEAGHKTQRAHRVAYEAYVGPIPDGLQLDHLCRNRACWSWRHLEAVTNAENSARSEPAMKTACVRGHEYTPANTFIRKNGTRNCRRCSADHQKDLRARRRAEKAVA